MPLVTTGILGYRTASLSLKKQAFNQLVSIREMKKKQIEDYFSSIRNQIQTFSEDKMVIDAMNEFKVAFNEFLDPNYTTAFQLEEYRDSLRSYYTEDFANEYKKRNIGRSPDSENFLNQLDDESVALQYFYVSENNNRLGEKHRLDFADDDSTYSRLHGNYHPTIRNYLEKFGYYDIFLVDPDSGDIVYSVFKELDFSTSLKDGLYASTNLGRVFREVNDSNKQDYTRLIDFEPYPPSYEGAASFIASPIFDGSEKIGVLIFQMPIDRINMIMTSNNDWESVGLGESGETYLIGDDFTMRNQSRFIIEDRERYFEQVASLGMSQNLLNNIKSKESTILLQRIETKGTKAVLSGETGIDIFPDYRNVLVLSAYAPLDIEDVKWAIMSEIDKEEALKSVVELRNSILKVTGIVGIFGILAIFLSVRIAKPIKKLTEGTKKVAEGDLAFKIQIKANDEVGDLADSFNNMTSQLIKSKEQLESQTIQLVQSEKMRVVGTMVAGVAHELNNPMMGILNYAQYCQKHTSPDDKTYNVLQDIEQETRRCTDIVSNMLLFSHMEDQDDRDQQETDCAEMLESVLKLLSYRIVKERVSIARHFEENIPGIMISPNKLQQVFLNLITNALDAIKENDGGKREINIYMCCEDAYLKITLADTGSGMDHESIQRVFEPYYTTKPSGEGTGLGLSLSCGIIEQYGGEITCDSKPGIGSSFVIMLPIKIEK